MSATAAPNASPEVGPQDDGIPADKWTRWMVAVAVMASAIMELVDTSAVNVSLPYIAGNLSASVDEATWVLTSYLVANAIVLPLSGWLANYFGRRRLLMMSITGFTAASILCGFAPNLPALVFFRVLQGAAGGALQPTSRAIMLETFPREDRGQAMAFLSGGLVVAGIGAYLFSHLNLNAGPWDFLWPQVVMGAGLSFMFVPLATITVDPIPQEEMGYATSLIALCRNLGAGIGISVFTAFVARREQFHQLRLAANMAQEPRLLSRVLSQLQLYLRHHGQIAGPGAHQSLAFLYHQLLQQASALSYLDGFRLMALLLLVTIPFVWIMRKPQFKSSVDAAD